MTHPGILVTDADELRDAIVADRVASAFRCEVGRFPSLCVLDWWLARDRKMIAVAELKVRRVDADTYPTVYLSAHKYTALTWAALAFGVRPIYFVGFRDRILWVDVRTLEVQTPEILGRVDRGYDGDLEPMLQVPINRMQVAEVLHE